MSSFPPMSGTILEHAAGTEIAEHRHPRGQLAVVTRGTMAVVSAEGLWLAPPGRGIWVPPGVTHGARYSEASALIQLLLAPELTDELPRTCQTIAVSSLLRELACEAARLPPDAAFQEDALLMARLIVRQAAPREEGPVLFVPYGRDPRLRRAVVFLVAHPGSTLNLPELAAQAGASTRTLARLFVTETGMSLGRWREHLRIVAAVDRLTRGRSITQTALELGYRSPSAFTTMFTRLLGMPPGRLVKTLR
ncbi:MAG TPA: helix-turn-helix transcriptional regulator [Acidocella sp.]|nr:helix-turn-helix transcriptional regulator [Acidocella sp.]